MLLISLGIGILPYEWDNLTEGGIVDYGEKLMQRISATEQRVDERKVLVQVVRASFEKKGADGVAEALAGQMDVIEEEFGGLLAKLEDML